MENQSENVANGHAASGDNYTDFNSIGNVDNVDNANNTNNADHTNNTGHNSSPGNAVYTCKIEYANNSGDAVNTLTTGYTDNADHVDNDDRASTNNMVYSSSPGNASYFDNGSYARYGPGQGSSFDRDGQVAHHYGYSPEGTIGFVCNTGHSNHGLNLFQSADFSGIGSSPPGCGNNAEYNFGSSNGYAYQDYRGGLGVEGGIGSTHAGEIHIAGVAVGPYPPLDEGTDLDGGPATESFENSDGLSDAATDITPDDGTHGTGPPLAGEATYVIVGRKGKAVKLYKQPRWDLSTALKHTPLAPKGTVFRWEDNTHIPRKPVIKGKVEKNKLVFEVVDTNGNYHERFFHRFDEQKWGNTRWVSDANKWRSQTIRRLFKYDPYFKTNEVREKWSQEEANDFKANVLRTVKRLGRNLAAEDWKELADKHNEQFSGISYMMRGTQTSRHGLRTATGLRTKYKRFPGLVEQVAGIIAEAVSAVEDESDEINIKTEKYE